MGMSPRLLRPRAGGVHPEAAAWKAAVVANGGSVSGSTLSAVDKFCKSIDAAGIRDRFYRLGIFAGNSLSAALVPLYRGPSRTGTQYGGTTDTNVNFVSGDYAETGASGGLTGNGTTKYLQTGFLGNTLATGDRHLSVYAMQNDTANFKGYIGIRDDVAGTYYFEMGTFNVATSIYGSVASAARAVSTGNSSGAFWLMSEPANNSLVLYKNSTSAATSSTSGRTLPNAFGIPVFALCNHPSTGAVSYQSNARLGSYSIGLSMTASQAASYYTALQALQTALSRNV